MSGFNANLMKKVKELEGLTRAATSSTIIKPDLKKFADIAKMVNSSSQIPKQYVKILKSRIAKERNIRSQKMLIELLEFLTCRCSRKFHTELNSKAFLQAMNSVFNRKLLNQEIKSKVILDFVFGRLYWEIWREIWKYNWEILYSFKGDIRILIFCRY